MNKLRKILVALDLGPQGHELTPGSRRAVDTALWLARKTGVRVVLVHSAARDEYWSVEKENFLVVHEGTPPEGIAVLEEVASEFRRDGVKTELDVTRERAITAITRHVEAAGIDLVIAGKRTESDHDGRRLGSLSRKLVHELACAVWVVKPDRDPRPERILAAVELDAVGRRVLELATSIAAANDAPLHVVHCVQLPMAVQMDDEREKLSQELVAKARAQLEERIGELGYEGSLELHVGVDSPTNAALAAERKLGIDLVVLGTVGRKGIQGLLVGNTSERLIAKLDSSILAVPPAKE